MFISLSAFAPENLVSRDGFSSPVPRQPIHLHHTQTEYGAYLRDSSRVPRRRPFNYFNPPYAFGPFPSLSGHTIACRWRSQPRVRWYRASKPQGCSERVLPWQVNIDQLICAYLPHTHYWVRSGHVLIHLRQGRSRVLGKVMYRAYHINSITLKGKHSGRPLTTRKDLERLYKIFF